MSGTVVKNYISPETDVFEGMISVRSVFEGIEKGVSLRKPSKLLFSEEKVKGNGKLLGFLKAKSFQFGYELLTVPEEEINSFASGSSHGGVVLLTGKRDYPEIPENPPEKGFFVLLEGIEDPFNLGYAIRSVYAAGADGIILPEHTPDFSDGTVCRSSAGASEMLPIYKGNASGAVARLKENGYRLAVADAEGEKVSFESDLTKPLILAVGGEKRGFSKKITSLADLTVRLEYGRDFPMALSAASASAVLAFEVTRQNRK